MHRIKLVSRGINSRRFRKLNSVADLVGQTVAVSEDDANVVESEVEAVKVNNDDSVDVTLATGDDMNLTEDEANELIETGSVESDSAEVETNCGPKRRGRNGDDVDETEVTEDEPTEFEVTRDVVDEDGEVQSIVTSKVDAIDEDDAIEKIQVVDSRRGRNSRNYRIRTKNSESPDKVDHEFVKLIDSWIDEVKKSGKVFTSLKDLYEKLIKQFEESGKKLSYNQSDVLREKLESAGFKIEEGSGRYGSSYVRYGNCDVKEFKIQRNCGKTRKIASVTAPSVEEAIEAVKAKDVADNIQAEGYAELVEELPKNETVVINSDIEEPIEDDTDPKEEDPKPEEPKEEDPKPENEESERESNSFKGVADYVRRAYGINI